MPKNIPTADDLPGLLKAAVLNLNAPDGITREQYRDRAIAANAQATLALAIVQTEANRRAETANLIAYLEAASQDRLTYQPSEAVLKSVQADVEVRLGLA